jgi:hypothetical protein
MKLSFLIICLLMPIISYSGARESFVKEVIRQCKVTETEAEKEVTPGRMGTVVRFKVCPQKNITLKSGCVLTCETEGAGL